MLFDPQLGGVLKLVVKGAHGEDVICSDVAAALCELLKERHGATELEAVTVE
jgi:hypothetical protein